MFPTTYEIKVNDSATNITGTVARPSRPSVKFTALDAPIITNKPNGIKKSPRCKIKFLKKGKYKSYKNSWSEKFERINKARDPIINCPVNLYLDFNPLEFLNFILRYHLTILNHPSLKKQRLMSTHKYLINLPKVKYLKLCNYYYYSAHGWSSCFLTI